MTFPFLGRREPPSPLPPLSHEEVLDLAWAEYQAAKARLDAACQDDCAIREPSQMRIGRIRATAKASPEKEKARREVRDASENWRKVLSSELVRQAIIRRRTHGT